MKGLAMLNQTPEIHSSWGISKRRKLRIASEIALLPSLIYRQFSLTSTALYLGYVALLTTSSLLSAAQNEDLIELTKDHTQFALSLYEQINPTANNFLFSPYSVSSCLSMVYLGARGETQSQMEKVLHLEIDQKNVAKTTALLIDSLTPKSLEKNTYKLFNANSLWVDQGVFLMTDFRYAIDKQFKASINKVNFSNPSDTLTTINSWVNDQTQHKISQILLPDDINELTRLVLINALYFQGNWRFPFELSKTQEGLFHPTPETTTAVPMMRQIRTIPYYENELVQIAALPFEGQSKAEGDLAFLVILPKSAENFEMMQKELSTELTHWVSSLNPMRIDLKIPKFVQNTRIDLNNALQEMGMEDAFDSEANFTGIDGMRDLSLNKVIHQAYFSIDEIGVVASATTAATMNVTAAPTKEPPAMFYADHPFLYFIIDLKSQELLFMGNMAQPPLSSSQANVFSEKESSDKTKLSEKDSTTDHKSTLDTSKTAQSGSH